MKTIKLILDNLILYTFIGLIFMEKINNVICIQGFMIDSNSYVFDDVIVDTGTGSNMDYLKGELLNAGIDIEDIKTIVNTHCHYDHIGGNKHFNADVLMHPEDAICIEEKNPITTASASFSNDFEFKPVTKTIVEGDKIGDFEVIHTPGHSKGGICLYDGEILISGDTIFSQGGVGRMDIGGRGDLGEMKSSIEKLSQLDVEYLLPGHGPWTDNANEHIKLSKKSLFGF